MCFSYLVVGFFFFLFFFFIFHPIYDLRPSVLSLLVVTQIRGHIAGSSPPPTTVHALHFFSREDFSSSFPRRLALNWREVKQDKMLE